MTFKNWLFLSCVINLISPFAQLTEIITNNWHKINPKNSLCACAMNANWFILFIDFELAFFLVRFIVVVRSRVHDFLTLSRCTCYVDEAIMSFMCVLAIECTAHSNQERRSKKTSSHFSLVAVPQIWRHRDEVVESPSFLFRFLLHGTTTTTTHTIQLNFFSA